MRALQYTEPGGSLTLVDLPDAEPPAQGAVLAVEATGLCRSDVHAWAGHDSDIVVGPHAGPGGTPATHVPGHELVGRVVAVGEGVDPAWVGRRATTPFVHACGSCAECLAGDGQVCRDQTQPGFTTQGSWAEQVVVRHATVNLVEVSEDVDGGAAALLGCRFATAYRGLVQRAQLRAGERVLVVGCGGVGLSAVMVAAALGAEVVAADVDARAVARAVELGAASTVTTAGLTPREVADAVLATGGSVAVSVDAVGRPGALDAGLLSLGRRGRHVQIGLVAAEPVVEVSRVVSHELALFGSHGMDARSYPELLELVTSGRLRPQDLVARWLPLDDAAGIEELVRAMDAGTAPVGVTMIRP
ncbi:alcohol dehydrogenase [Quadrisphaera granulorum]|uniref:Alcohol dehydrogenase n=1 Tax=Quadrisphaera granulorum TaxID=317664 RepID=A0A316A9J9_9ACTN|nr:alcohol dehydrogenase catalytic domain-containing protein [Quadrisphaera granulorum]PWJ54596.1 alcohol dehydrogenase [Quadrisphaera granulorum]SZE95958.1 alcohol dehydrogenase [Quadrisphaera granulorum]